MKHVVALFDRQEQAVSAVQDLLRNGFERENISLVANSTEATGEPDSTARSQAADSPAGGAAAGAGLGAVLGGLGGLLVGLGMLAIPGIGPVLAAGPLAAALAGAGIGAVTGGLVGALVDLGIPKEDADVYVESIRSGGTLLIARVTDERASQVIDILDRHNPVDIDERGVHLRSQTGQGSDTGAQPYDAQQVEAWRGAAHTGSDDLIEAGPVSETQRRRAPDQPRSSEEMSLPVTGDEQVAGKREVPKSRMRVHTYVTGERVGKQNSVHNLHGGVGQRLANRQLTEDVLNAFEEGVIEIESVDEEPVVEKQARVTEEVYINKTVDHQQRTIPGTERHMHVDVNKLDPQDRQAFEVDFRKHFDSTYSHSGREYNQLRDAYFYGFQQGADQRFQNYSWEQAQQPLRMEWERESPGMHWEDVREAVGAGYRLSHRK